MNKNITGYHSLTVKTTQLYLTVCDPVNSPGQSTRVGSLSLLQGIFPTQGSNPGVPHSRQILYQLSHKAIMMLREDLGRKDLRTVLPQMSFIK